MARNKSAPRKRNRQNSRQTGGRVFSMPRRRSSRLAGHASSPAPSPAAVPKDPSPPPETLPESAGSQECAICLQPLCRPVVLPCSHIFCFLCAKGICNLRQKCAMCRMFIPPDYILNPKFLFPKDTGPPLESPPADTFQWFYEGRNGWWQYDERTSEDLEDAYTKKEKKCEVLVAGFLYVVDFEHMLQFRQHEPGRRRRIKRDRADATKKGVAGIRNATTTSQQQPTSSVKDQQPAAQDMPSTSSKEDHQPPQNTSAADATTVIGVLLDGHLILTPLPATPE